jgi:RHS repeat-associated protein
VKSQADADAVYATYRFFADDRRASKAVTHRGELDTTLYFLYDGPEVIEERDGSEAVVQQYVYGPRHIDDLAMIRGRNGTSFVHTDANWNVIGLTTPAGLLAEEYNYTPYGRMLARRHTGFGDADGDGDVDAADQTAWNATQGGGGVYNRNLDADYDGDNDFYDESAWLAAYNAPGTSAIVPHRAWSPSGNPYGFTARRLDPESMLMHYRWRAYNPTLKRFMQRDPLGYIGGPSLYEYVTGNPLRYLDPWGLIVRGKDGSIFTTRTGTRVTSYQDRTVNGLGGVRFKLTYAVLIAYTDRGEPIQVYKLVNIEALLDDPTARPAGLAETVEELKKGGEYNCHGFCFFDSEYWFQTNPDDKNAFLEFLKADGYTITLIPRPGDLVVYYDKGGDVVHTARVRRVIRTRWGTRVIVEGNNRLDPEDTTGPVERHGPAHDHYEFWRKRECD